VRTDPTPSLLPRRWRVAGWLALAVALGAGFMAYGHPSIMVQWENLMALCGLA